MLVSGFEPQTLERLREEIDSDR